MSLSFNNRMLIGPTLEYARQRGLLPPEKSASARIKEIILQTGADFSMLSKEQKYIFKKFGSSLRELDCSHTNPKDLTRIEWTKEKIEALAHHFPNLETVNFNGAFIRELDGVFGALSSLKKLKTLSMNDATIKDRHIEALAKKTGITALTSSLSVGGIEKKITPVFPRLIQYDSRLDDIISSDTKIEKLADGFEWVEGPVWNKSEGHLLFSDIPRNSIFKWREGEGVTLFRNPSGYLGKKAFEGKEPGSNALAYNAKGELHVCQHGERRIVRIGPKGEEIVVADKYKGMRLNSPNDLVFKSTGELYFTDPPYGLPLRFDDPSKETPFCGVYRVKKDGEVELLTKDLKVPNGLAFSPDEKYLYVSNTGNKVLKDAPRWYRFEVNEDGSLGNKEVFYESSLFSEKRPGSPDGLKVDEKGNLYCAGPGGLYIFSPDATLLGMIEFAEPTANCNWGGKNGSTLYITQNHAIYRVEMNNKGSL
jgi:gluconolactonase